MCSSPASEENKNGLFLQETLKVVTNGDRGRARRGRGESR